jgi:hypothetical protein
MKHGLACILAIAGWYLFYPPATHNSSPDSYPVLSHWHIDGSYSSAADCEEAHRSDLNARTPAIFCKPRTADVSRPTIPASLGSRLGKHSASRDRNARPTPVAPTMMARMAKQTGLEPTDR